MKPTIGRIVIYTSKIDNGPGNDVESPAVVLRTKATTVQEVIERWGPEPHEVEGIDGQTHTTASRPGSFVAELTDDYTVDLLVWGLGKDYREYSVKFGHALGHWRWPRDEDNESTRLALSYCLASDFCGNVAMGLNENNVLACVLHGGRM